jgi:hypothetical protein
MPLEFIADGIQEELHGLNRIVLLLVLQYALRYVQPEWQTNQMNLPTFDFFLTVFKLRRMP